MLAEQDKPRGDVFAGYSFEHAQIGPGSVGLHGYDVSSDLNLRPWLAITLDDDGHFGSAIDPFCFGSSSNMCRDRAHNVHQTLYFSGGLRFSTSKGRLTSFARALFGFTSLDACPIVGCESKASFSQSYGGG